MKQSVHTFPRIVGAALALLVVLALPTGWLYDLWAGTGSGPAGRSGASSGGAKRSVYVSEITADYPLPAWEYALRRVAAGGYLYYLMELGDNSWLCVYFDDYLTLTETDAYPTGYVRYTATEERRMLNRMAEDYDVDSVYVLDMYRHGKVSWMLDAGLRLAVVLVIHLIVAATRGYWRRRRDADE